MKPPDEAAAVLLEKAVLLGLLIVASLALGWILLPFFGTILWGCVIAMLFAPFNRWLLLRLRRQRTLAALATLLVALVVVVLPLAAAVRSLTVEALQVYERISTGEWQPAQTLHIAFDALPRWARRLLDHFGVADFATVQRRLDTGLAEASRWLATQAFSVGQDTLAFVAGMFITMYLAFFMLRDGEVMARALRRTVPLAPAHTQALIDRFVEVVRAVVKGHLLVAGVQGALGGLAFWLLGVEPAVLWAAVMAFLSLVPVVGAALVWLPVALYFLATGALWQGMALVVYGVLVIGLADNVLRPILVGRDTRLHDYVVLVTTLGGVTAFGINGLLLGPAIAAMFLAVWRLEAEVVHGEAVGAPAHRPATAKPVVSDATQHTAANDGPQGREDDP